MEPPQTERFHRANAILVEALDVPAASRTRFIEERCAGDLALKTSVFRMLATFEELGDFLEEPAGPLNPTALQPGDVLASRFRITRKLGAGGMGEVYQAQDETLNETVAIKLIRGDLRRSPEMEQRFRDELRLARKVSHPNVCRVFDVFSEPRSTGQLLFFTMEYLDGESLAARLRAAGKLAPADALSIGAQIAAGLDAAHRAEILHRDLKPANIMLVPAAGGGERAVITDFGLARTSESPTHNTQPGQLVGSILYMAPEQLLEDRISAASDIYSFGLILFEMVAGQAPFPDETAIRTALRRTSQDPPQLSAIAPGAPSGWDQALLRALARDPARRQKSAEELIGELRRTMRRRMPSRRVLLRTAVAGIAAASLGGILRFYRWRPPRLPDSPTIMFANASTSAAERQAAAAFILSVERQMDAARIEWLSPLRVRQVWARMRGDRTPLPDALDPRQAREISARAGANIVVFTGATRKLDDWSFWLRLELLGASPAEPVDYWEHEFRTASSGDRFTASGEAARWVRESVLRRALPRGTRERTPQELTTTSWEALEEFTQAEESRSNADEAVRHLKTALELDPDFPLAASRMADVLTSQGRVDEGLLYYSRAAEAARRKDLTDIESLRMQTLFALDTGQSAKAAESAARWAAEAPGDFEPLVHRATALEWLGQTDAALHTLDIAIQLSPNSRSPLMRRAMLDLRSGNFAESQAGCDRLFQMPPADSTWQLKGALAFAHLDMAGAWRALEQMSRSQAENVRSTAYCLEACYRAEQGRRDEAARVLGDGIRFERERASTAGEIKKRRLLAQLLLLEGNASEARRQCALALAAQPGHAAAMEIGCVLAQTGDVRGARACLREGVPDWPIYSHWSARLRGEIELASGHHAKALDLMSKAPADPGYAAAEWPGYLARAAADAGQRTLLLQLVGELAANPARYWFNADFNSPGFIMAAFDRYKGEIDSSLAARISPLRGALANSK